MELRNMKGLLPAVVSGALLILSSAPFDMWPLAYIALVPLLVASKGRGVKETILLYTSTGTLLAAGWFYSSISFSPFFFLLIIIILSLSFSLWGILIRLMEKKISSPLLQAFMPAVLWTGIERINTSEMIGMPANLAITQAGHPIMIQLASFLGIYGVSFLIVLVNTGIAFLFIHVKSEPKINIRKLAPVMMIMGLFIANMVFGYARLSSDQAHSPTIKISTVQPVITTDMYVNGWRNPENRKFMKTTLDRLTAEAVASGAQMIFWPEGGNGYMNMRIPELREKIYKIAQENDLDFIVSSNDIDGEGRKFNSIFSISRKGRLLGRYDKVRLVPIAEADYTAGSGFRAIPSSFGKIGPAVCFESCFPSILRKVTSLGAELLLVSTSDATFKRSALALNHAKVAVFRAVENGRWLIRAANTGPSLIISPTGKVSQQTKFYDRNIMVGEVAPLQELTFFTRMGFLVPESFALLVLLFSFYSLVLMWKEKSPKSVSAKRVKNRKKPKIQPNHFDIKKLIKRSKTALTFVSIHLALILILIPISIYFVKVSTSSELGYAQMLNDFFTPAGQLQAERVTQKFLQAKKNTCGPAVLAYLFSYFGRETLEDDLVNQVHLEEQGTSMLELKMAAQRYGFDASGVQENYAALREEVLPVIAYINNSHYVVVIKVYPNYLFLFDPALGHITVTRRTFEQMWNGYLLLVRMKSIPESLAVADFSNKTALNPS